MEQTQQPESCAICGYYRTVARVVQLGGGPRRVCRVCAALGKGLRQQGVDALVSHCLHLFACELEHEAQNRDLSTLALPGRYESRLARRLESGDLRAACGCNRCRGLKPQTVADPFESDGVWLVGENCVVASDLHGLFDDGSEVSGDEMPLQLVRAMRDSERLTHANGEVWRAVDEVARRLVKNAQSIRRGPLSHLAQSAMPLPPTVVSSAQRVADDERARACWHFFNERLPDE